MTDVRTRLLALAAAVAILAIGVVLGSGPLRSALLGDVGGELDALQAQADAEASARQDAEAATEAATAYVDGVAPALVAGRLAGLSVLLVTVPGSDPAGVTALEERIVAAGGTAEGPVAVEQGWDADETATFREALAAQVAPTVVGIEADAAASVLAHAFVQGATGGAVPSGTDPAEVDAAGGDRPAVLWSLLEQAGLAAGDAATRADAVVVVAGADAVDADALVKALVRYDAPVTVVGDADQLGAVAVPAAASSVAVDGWVIGSVTAAVAVAESWAGQVVRYGVDEVPAALGASAAPTGAGG